MSWMHQYVHQSPTISRFLQDFSQGKARSGSDGSFVPQWLKGLFAWRVELNDRTEIVEGGGIVSGPPEAQCSFCSEVCGVTGIIHEVEHLEEKATPEPILLTGCGSLSTLYQCMKPVYSIKARQHHCDVLSHLQALIHSNRSKHTWLHVKAHQSRFQPKKKLSPNTLLNEKMDTLAGKVMTAYPKALPFTPTLGMPIVWVGNCQLTGNIKQSLYIHLT